MERVKYLQNNDLFSGYSNFCFQFIFGIETKIASSARMCSGSNCFKFLVFDARVRTFLKVL